MLFACLLQTQLQEIKQWQNTGGSAQLQTRFLDPAVNIVIQRLKQELDERKAKIELTENDLQAAKFTPDRYLRGQLLIANYPQRFSGPKFAWQTLSSWLEGDQVYTGQFNLLINNYLIYSCV